ncbi:hypothetical protein [Maribellus sediminis]|uniref:glycosyl-4,4'-diaponeurosporenoate acyltransferase CrtO family protein n=1 Tax=Maribellus sediminis TaxID=2696285 RepID=UPI00142FC00F|nr:hypothetical protein [Maribellus sediminis]
MKTLKKIVFPLFSLFLLYRSVELVKTLMVSGSSEHTVGEQFLLAFLLSIFITGVFAIVGFAWPTSKIFPRSFYTLKNAGILKKTYRILGVDLFRKALLIFFWGRKKNRKKYFDGTRKGLQNFIYQSKQSEFGHFASFVSIALVSFLFLAKGMFLLVAFLTLINVIGNFYPVILQRYHRLRIDKLQSRLATD